LFVPLTGNDVGTWGSVALNPNFVALDGLFGGVQTLSLSNSPVTLTVPAGFTATPSPGPTQAQNAVLRLTGALTGNVQITLPLPGYYIVENLTTGNFVVTLQGVTATQIIGINQGMCQHIYNDGANVRFVNLGETGKMEFWTGYTAMPAWVTSCTKPPYLLCDGTATYLIATYPYLANRYGTNFGGNGLTTFGVPDMQGRVPLAYDGTGTRITTAISGINGQTMGAAGGNQALGSHTHTFSTSPQTPTTNQSGVPFNTRNAFISTGTGSGIFVPQSDGSSYGNLSVTFSVSGTTNGSGAGSSQNVQPTQVAGVWVVRAA
jgi:microcystin-dependent protein